MSFSKFEVGALFPVFGAKGTETQSRRLSGVGRDGSDTRSQDKRPLVARLQSQRLGEVRSLHG